MIKKSENFDSFMRTKYIHSLRVNQNSAKIPLKFLYTSAGRVEVFNA